MHILWTVASALLAACSVQASPTPDLDQRNLTPLQCSKVATVVKVLKLKKATPFCLSFLSIKPATFTSTLTKVETKTTTVTSTITQGTPSTSVVFRPGNPPAAPAKEKRYPANAAHGNEKRGEMAHLVNRATTPTIPSYVTAIATSIISSACECLGIPTRTTIITQSSTKTSDKTISVFVAPSVITSTYYPCATPIPNLTPTLPYGLANQAGVVSSQNTLYGSNDPADSLEGCCNLCFFGIPNCIQAFYYSYEGCVVQQAQTVNGTGIGVSGVCPSGKIDGLTYSPDNNPPFRSTGDIAGPCGVQYNDLT